MKSRTRQPLLATVSGGFGYLSVLMQWLWVAVLFLPSLLDNKTVKDFLLPDSTGQPTPDIEINGPPMLLTTIAVVITLAVLAMTAVVLARLPASIERAGRKVTENTAAATVPLLIRHQQISVKRRRELTDRLIKIIKLALILLPVCLLPLLFIAPAAIDSSIAVFIQSCLAIGSLLWFSAEYALASRASKRRRE